MSRLHVESIVVRGRARPRLKVDALALDVGLVVLIGKNGAGKSTLLDVCAGVLRPDVGVVSVDGVDLRGLSARARSQRIASLGQRPQAALGITVFARIAQGLAPRRGPDAAVNDDSAAAVYAIAAAVGITDFLDARLDEISGGEAQRTHIARALVDDSARCVILDEPLAGLDEAAALAVVAVLRARARHQLVMLSIHDVGMAALCGGRVLGLNDGELAFDVDSVDGSSAVALNEHAERLLGSPLRVVDEEGWVGVTRRRPSSLQSRTMS
jgi:iron complex transport system ATP-binding protein